MKLIIDGHEMVAEAGKSLLDMIRELGLVTGKLSTEPIAAMAASPKAFACALSTMVEMLFRASAERPSAEGRNTPLGK